MNRNDFDPTRLAEELLNTNAHGLKRRLYRVDRKRRLVFFRNMQNNGLWQTRYILPSKGYRVTLAEELAMLTHERERFRRANYRTVAVQIEPIG